ncbi:hypothetical protein [Flavobacterium sp.]|uniref:hypothetical protein n=1 Tax=Flavobacterium sp. TaxID=239 RepID=UPI00374DBC1F
MKKFLFIIILLAFIGFIYLYIQELSFSPLKEKEFKILFPNYNVSGEKKCGIDFLGMNFKGEVFEFYLYKMNNAKVDTSYPKIKNEWENEELDSDAIVLKWKPCPIDSTTIAQYKFALTANNLDDKECSRLFNSDINNPKNYYSYVYFNELEHYFLLYCPDKESLYYIRRKGF